jgi:alpha-L-rhamnosidase
LTDGIFGPISNSISGSHPSFATCGSGGGTSVTYTLPAAATNGYDLTNIVVYGGWNDNGRDQQGYTIYYSTRQSPANFIPLTTVNYSPSVSNGVQSATRVTIAPATAAPLASDVAMMEFNFTTVPVANGYSGYAELQVFGQPSPVPVIANLPVSSPGPSVGNGTSITLTETASGTPPLQYQWQTDNGSGGASYTDIAGATSTNYMLVTSASGNNSIDYRVLVTGANGISATSPAITITVTDPSVLTMTATNLLCEDLQNPLGIDVTLPRLSWINHLPERGGGQSAYQILVASSPAILAQNQGDLWNSGKVVSDQSVLVSYDGQTLGSGEACYWMVRVWDENGIASAWSPPGMWSMGLLNASDWTAQWIGMDENTNISPAPPSPMLRKSFAISKTVARATAYICGLGYYELQFNGVKVGDHVLDPSWTLYNNHAYYTTYDVTTNLLQGTNAIGVQLANGFYNQWTSDAWNTYTAPWRALPEMILQVVIQYSDGTQDTIVSDSSWKAATGPLLLDTTRLGEVYDARLEQPGWSTAGYDDSTWSNVVVRAGTGGSLLAPDAPPVEVFQSVYPVRIIPVSGHPGVYTFDFGQNLVGWGQLTVNGPAGTSVSMVYGELTNSDGSVNQNNINVYVTLQQYFQTDTYILKGGGTETYAPRFTYHGFQYAEVTGLPAGATTNTLVAQVVHTAICPAGNFLCSCDLLNRIETNTLWSYLGNFVGIPTDCPQREKNGWTGDAQLACEVGLTHFNAAPAYARWLKEFGPGQQSNGELSGVFPNANWGYGEGPAWESASQMIPWFVYEHCGDAAILTNNYATMKAYEDYETSVASENIVSYGLGDWEPASTVTPAAVTDTGYYFQGALVVARTAALMGNSADAVEYSNLAAQIQISFNTAFLNTNDNEYAGGTQTAQSCALYQGLVNSNEIPAVADSLATAVQQNGNTIDTGILGSKYLLRALCDNGHSDTAMALAMQTNYPGWGNWVLRGATTLWETWSGNGATDSHNHIMFGDISAWFMEYLAGIRPGAPGYKSVIIKPEITGAIAWAEGTHDSPYGTISSAWQINGRTITLNVTIPPGTAAIVYLPTLGTPATNLVIQESGANIWADGTAAGNDPGVVYDHATGTNSQTYSVWDVSPGTYQFSWNVYPSPNGLSARAGSGWVGLAWVPTPGATSYNVKRSTSPGGPYSVLASAVLTPGFTDVAVTNGRTYFYVVSAVSPDGESGNSTEVAATPTSIPDFSFETPLVSDYQYDPTNATWVFSGASPNGSGLIANGSGFGNPPAPDGVQAAFVQSYGTISQTLSGFVPRTNYTVSYYAAQRSGANQNGGESWNVLIDGAVIQTNQPGATSYTNYSATFTATAGTQTLSFAGTDLATGDNTVFIDDVRISPPITPGISTVTLTSPANNASFLSSGTVDLTATVATNGNSINSVQFYANTTNFLGQLTTAPYSLSWTNVVAGDYSLIASVIFNGGGVANSAAVNVLVTNLAPAIGLVELGAGGQQLNILGTGQMGHTYVLEATTNLVPPVDWSRIQTNVADTFGNFSFTNSPLTNAIQFFRIAAP